MKSGVLIVAEKLPLTQEGLRCLQYVLTSLGWLFVQGDTRESDGFQKKSTR